MNRQDPRPSSNVKRCSWCHSDRCDCAPLTVLLFAFVALALALGALFAGCTGALQGGTIGGGNGTPLPLPASMNAFDLVACRDAVADNYCDGPASARFTITPVSVSQSPRVQTGDGDGYVFVPGIPSTWTEVTVDIAADGYVPLHTTIQTADLMKANAGGLHNFFPLVAAHVDPSAIPLEQLAAIRGAMWTARLNLPFGPRPGRDDNIIAFDFYQFYGATDRARMVAAYKSRGYTHAVTGPVAGTDCYHGQFDCHDDGPYHMPDDGSAPTQAEWDAYLDAVQELWDRGLIPVYFHKPDGWEVPSMGPSLDALDALARQPRAQKLLRVVVYEGWEPSGSKYGWSNATYVALAQRGAAVFPHALRLLHTVADLDAPVGQNDDQLHITNGQGWANVAPYIHGWLSQWGGYVGSGSCTLQAPFTTDFPLAIHDQIDRFTTGRAGWPTTSAWGNAPVLVYAGEYAAFTTYWNNCPESASITIGNLAMHAGAAGYLDGGSAPVPVPR